MIFVVLAMGSRRCGFSEARIFPESASMTTPARARIGGAGKLWAPDSEALLDLASAVEDRSRAREIARKARLSIAGQCSASAEARTTPDASATGPSVVAGR